MAGYNFTERAALDLRGIIRHTKKTWGVKQARLYRQELELAPQQLSLSPDMGRKREEIAIDVRSFPVASHIVFYTPRRGGITVVRLLHSRMDVELAFDRKT